MIRLLVFALLTLTGVLFAHCGSHARVKAGMHTSKIYFCEGKMYVYDDLLSRPVGRRIEKGIYVQFEITDSTKLSPGVQFPNEKYFQSIEGKYVQVTKISKQEEEGMTRLWLYDGVFE